jgi:hypothetical protein
LTGIAHYFYSRSKEVDEDIFIAQKKRGADIFLLKRSKAGTQDANAFQ